MTSRPRGLKIFRAAGAAQLDDTGMMTRVSDGLSPELGDKLTELRTEVIADDGARLTVLFRGDGPDGFSLVHVWFKPDYALPRHTHDVDCLYYVISGSAHLGSQSLGPGDGFFIPAGSPYAYSAGQEGVEVLEFRQATSFDIRMPGLTAAFLDMAADIRRSHQAQWTQLTTAPSWDGLTGERAPQRSGHPRDTQGVN